MTKTITSCNWIASRVTEEDLNDFIQTGVLANKDAIHLRVPGTENPPEQKEGEVIVFTNHMLPGFTPPSSKNFHDIVHFFKLHPQDNGPNSVSNIRNFQVFCEVYLQEEPTVELLSEPPERIHQRS